MNERTVKCNICGEPYKFYAYSAADQSACPDCVKKAEMKSQERFRKGDHKYVGGNDAPMPRY